MTNNPYVKAITGHVRQAITTRYRGATNHSGARVLVTTEGVRKTVAWDHALSATENHAAAAFEVFRSLAWDTHNDLVMGDTKEGYVFVQVPKGCGVPARGYSSGETIKWGQR